MSALITRSTRRLHSIRTRTQDADAKPQKHSKFLGEIERVCRYVSAKCSTIESRWRNPAVAHPKIILFRFECYKFIRMKNKFVSLSTLILQWSDFNWTACARENIKRKFTITNREMNWWWRKKEKTVYLHYNCEAKLPLLLQTSIYAHKCEGTNRARERENEVIFCSFVLLFENVQIKNENETQCHKKQHARKRW